VLKHNFIKIIAFILISSLFFSSSVYAKMQAMSDDDLIRINAETGITIALNTNAYLKATSVGLFTTTTETSGIVLPNLVIDGTVNTTTDNYTNPSAVNINSTIVLDIGTLSGKTWLNISGLNIYNPMGLTSKGIYIEDGANDRILGDLYIRGIFMGRTLIGAGDGTPTVGYSGNHTFTMGESPFIRVSGHSGAGTTTGIDLFASMNLYVDTLELRYRPATTTPEFKVTGIYLCNTATGTAETPSTWVPSGNFAIGLYDPPLYNITGETDYPASIDVGTASGKTYLSLNLPLSGTIGVKEFKMDDTANFGPIAITNAVFKTLTITLSSF